MERHVAHKQSVLLSPTVLILNKWTRKPRETANHRLEWKMAVMMEERKEERRSGFIVYRD